MDVLRSLDVFPAEVLDHCIEPYLYDTAEDAVRHGDLDTLRQGRLSGSIYSNIANLAAGYGHQHIVEWAYSQGLSCSTNIAKHVARAGEMKMLTWLAIEKNISLAGCMREAVVIGHIDMVAWLILERRSCTSLILYEAAKTEYQSSEAKERQRDIVKLLYTYRSECLSRLINEAARESDLKMLIKDFLDDTEVVANTETLTWWLKQKADCAELAADPATKKKYAKIALAYWKRVGVCPPGVLDKFAERGDLEMVKWLDAQGAACTPEAMNGAAKGGFFEVVVWLDRNRTEGCTEDALQDAKFHEHAMVVAYLCVYRWEDCQRPSAKKRYESSSSWLLREKWLQGI